jgi:agmatine deiminase
MATETGKPTPMAYVANDVIVTAKLGIEGRSESFRRSDALAREALSRAFPGREIAMIEATALLHDGGGLHCHSRNQPFADAPRMPERWMAR